MLELTVPEILRKAAAVVRLGWCQFTRDNSFKEHCALGAIEVEYPHYKCLVPQFGKVSFFLEGTQKSALMTGTSEQPECTLIPVSITLEEADYTAILDESFGLFEELCTDCATESARIYNLHESIS